MNAALESAASHAATLYVIGLGPGDPELMTVKAARIVRGARVIAFFAKAGRPGHARSIVAGLLSPSCEELRFEYPFTTEVSLAESRYHEEMRCFYDDSAARIADRLRAGQDVALLCEGDPFFYGSAMYLFDRLASKHPTIVVPGITAMSGCSARALMPITHGDDVLSVVPGTLDEDSLTDHLRGSDATVVMKVGRQLPKIRRAIERAGKLDRALYVERGTQEGERIAPLAGMTTESAPYFSLILVPGREGQR
jgi:precorrin-2/cobalt-factor-2 C20-methyltransferase